jgi:agmatinase
LTTFIDICLPGPSVAVFALHRYPSADDFSRARHPIEVYPKVVVYGVPFDDTATFGKGTARGPEGLRHVSARQIETYVVDERIDLFERVPIFDLGDFKIRGALTDEERTLLQNHSGSKVLARVDSVMKQFDALKDVTQFLRKEGKIPLMIGGEHTLTYWPLCALASERPVVLHFDAHRDAKAEYLGMRLCHTTPMYHYLQEHGGASDFIQIGIRQTDAEEQAFAERAGVVTFYPKDVRSGLDKVCAWIRNKTKNRNVYVTFDIDALDICYTPCTGTPEPFGLTPQEAVEIFKAVHPSAKLIGADMMEVAVKNNEFREATTAVQLVLRLLAREYVR